MSVAPRLLILTATLGRSPWLEETLASVPPSVASEAEHVLVAPASACSALRVRFPHLRVEEDAGKDQGLYGALNAGLTASWERPWTHFTFIADDDAFLPGLAEVWAAARQRSATERHVDQGEVVMVREGGRRLCRVPRTHRAEDIAALVAAGISPFNQQGMLYTRAALEAAGPFDADGKICSDASHWLAALEAHAHFHGHRTEAALFRVRAGQLSGDESQHRAEYAALAARARRLHPGSTWAAKARFRWDNRGAYLERLRRVGWRGGFALLAEKDA